MIEVKDDKAIELTSSFCQDHLLERVLANQNKRSYNETTIMQIPKKKRIFQNRKKSKYYKWDSSTIMVKSTTSMVKIYNVYNQSLPKKIKSIKKIEYMKGKNIVEYE